MRTPNQERKNQRREMILRAASELFARKNYHEVLMSHVAERANIAKGSVYNYFPNKENLYISIITSRLEALLNLLKARIDHRHTPLINLRRTIIHIYSFMAKYSQFFRIWYKEKLNCRRSSHTEIERLDREIKAVMAASLESCINNGLLRPHAAGFVVDVILGMIDAAVIRSFQLNVAQRRTERLLLYEFIIDSLGTPKARQLHLEGKDEPAEEEREVYAS